MLHKALNDAVRPGRLIEEDEPDRYPNLYLDTSATKWITRELGRRRELAARGRGGARR